MMIHDVSAASGETGKRLEVRGKNRQRSSFFLSLSAGPLPGFYAGLRGPCANNNVNCQLYIQILAQYNSEVLHACCREGYVCAYRPDLSGQELPLPP